MELNVDNLDYQYFFDESFDVDSYLSNNMQKVDFVTLRKQLKKLGTQLHHETVNILKSETKSIVNFAESLSLLNSKVTSLSQPVSQFKEEIGNLYSTILNIQDSYKKISKNLQVSGCEQKLINLKIGIISSIAYIKSIIDSKDVSKEELITLEWIVNEYSYQMIYLKELGLNYSDFDLYINEVEDKLKNFLNQIFLKVFLEKDENTLLRCLRLYVSLSKQAEAEKLIRKDIVRPKLKSIFSEENFEKSNRDLNVLYTQTLDFLHKDLSILYSMINQNPEITGFNFIFNSFWTEVDIELVEGLSNVTAPGNPQLFQKRFRDSWNFLQEIIKYDHNSEKNRSSYYQAHIKRFNLPVYFEIRYQQIGSQLEESLVIDLADSKVIERDTDKDFKLKPTNVLWECLNMCFKEDIFLEHLSDQFVRLSMLILSRFLKWLETLVQSTSHDTDKLQEFTVYALYDLVQLKLKVGSSSVVETSIYKILPSKLEPLILKIFESNERKLNDVQSIIEKKLIQQKIQEAFVYLQQVTSIPRIYRRTNRSIPKEPNSYVVELTNDLKDFNNKYTKVTDIITKVLDIVIKEVTERYIVLIREVLNSVSKTEKSLRRLKNRSLNSTDEIFNPGNSESVSDETKIKIQIKLDVQFYVNEVQKFLLGESLSTLKSLSQEINF